MSLRTCVICKNSINVPDYHTKYCPDCKKKVWEEQKSDWKKRHPGYDNKKYVPRRNLLFCTKCFNQLPDKSNCDRKYCDKCIITVKKLLRKKLYHSNVEKRPLLLLQASKRGAPAYGTKGVQK